LRLLRTQRAGKTNARGPVPVVTGSDDAAILLDSRRESAIAYFERAAARLECDLIAYRSEPRPDPEEIARLTAERDNERERIDAATQTRVYGPGELAQLPEPENTKIQVVHHGWAGYPYLMATSGHSPASLAIENLPLHWKSHGLSPKIGSVSLNACGSGDAVPREHLISYPYGYHGPPSDTRTALAQYLADAMRDAGFVEPRVTGYQGIGLSIPNYLRKSAAYVPMIREQGVSLPEESYAVRVGLDSDMAWVDIARRSDVAMVFEPTDPDRGRKPLRYEHAYMYAPRSDGDTFEFALEENVRRLAKWVDASYFRPRGPIPLLAASEEVRRGLVDVRAKRMRELSAEVKSAREERRMCERASNDASLSDGDRDDMQKKIEDLDFVIKERSFYLAAAEATQIKAWEALTAVGDAMGKSAAEIEALRTAKLATTKMYIALYGSAGSDRLTTDRSEPPTEVSLAEISRDLAQRFLAENVTPHIGSFRLLARESADTKPRRKFEANPPGYTGLFSNRRVAPAQYLANQLKEDGFVRPRVTGYQGQGVFWATAKHLVNAESEAEHSSASARHQGWGSASIAPPYAIHIVPGRASDWKRRSEVGKVFKPKRGLALVCL